MASFGAKYIKFAGIKGEPAGKLPIYEAAVELGKLVKAELTVNIATGELYANNMLAEKSDEFISGTLAVEVDDMEKEVEGAVYGSAYNDGELVDNAADVVPYGGLAYYKTLQRSGKPVFEACYYPKAKAILSTDTAATKGSSIPFNTKPLSFTIYEPDNGDWRYRKEFATEKEAIAYVDEKLGRTAEA